MYTSYVLYCVSSLNFIEILLLIKVKIDQDESEFMKWIFYCSSPPKLSQNIMCKKINNNNNKDSFNKNFCSLTNTILRRKKNQ